MEIAKKVFGLGCGPDGGGCGPLARGVYDFLSMGLPRLALARALGVPFAPYVMNVRATFDTTDAQIIPMRGADVKVSQDVLVDAIIVRVGTDRPAPNVFTPQSDFFNQYMNGVEATLAVQGAPRYVVSEGYTPLSSLGDVANGVWPRGWGLTYQQQIFMGFQSRFALPDFPTTVVVTFRAWQPATQMFEMMPSKEAIERLVKCGVEIPECYLLDCK